MTEYKFWIVYHEGQPRGRFDQYDRATEKATEIAADDPERRSVYVLEAVWYCRAKTAYDKEKITETVPQAPPRELYQEGR